MSDQSNLCTRCDADNANRDSYFCADCEARYATVNRLCNLAADDDGEVFIPMTADELAAMHARMAASPEPNF